MITIRKAGALDARPLAELLNTFITDGTTTALTQTVTGDDLRAWMASAPDHSAWHLAEDEKGQVAGLQWIEPADYLPQEAAEIASFVQMGRSGLGIGSRLFDATRSAAKTLGYRWINANIRADNAGGLAYYQSRGFETYDHWSNYQLPDGRVVDKVLKRYDL